MSNLQSASGRQALLGAIQYATHTFGELRTGQIIENALVTAGRPESDLWIVPDIALADMIIAYANKYRNT